MLIGVETWMNEMADIRERIAQHTEEKRTVWLRQIHRRYSVWMFISGVFAVLVTLAAIVAKSLLFGVVAAFLCMFAWNRWGECRRVENWLSRPTPENEKDRIIWARTFYDGMSHPSLWLRITEWISAVIAVALVLTVSVVLIATTGLWMRLLYGLTYILVACFFLLWLLARRKLSREMKTRIALSGEQWNELT